MSDGTKDMLGLPDQQQGIIDAPPEYTAAEPQASSSSNEFVNQPPSEDIAHLFTRPQFAEDLYQSIDPEGLHSISDTQWTVTSEGDVRSWDPKLSDPMVLYEFIRYHAQIPPSVRIQCRGTHPEWRDHHETVTENGRTRTERRSHQETVVDFDFSIDLTRLLQPPTLPPTAVDFFSVAPDVPAFRGSRELTFAPVDSPHSVKPGTKANRSLSKLWFDFGAWRFDRGLPSWASMPPDFMQKHRRIKRCKSRRRNQLTQAEEGEALLETEDGLRATGTNQRDRAAIMDWCTDFCASPAILKEFTLCKQVWGWDTKAVKTAVTSAILSTGYRSTHKLQVDIIVEGAAVTVLPDNWLSRSLHNPWIFFLSCITLIYPFIWLWAYYSKRGSPLWSVVHVAYPLKAYRELSDKVPTEGLTIKAGPNGKRHFLVGTREGAWVREWENTIKEAVISQRQGYLTSMVDSPCDPAVYALDGYAPDS